ncbi:MAG TPA: hypothetical protein VFK06_15295 [Candidatus Angelobacter sp.]|nr:hypothetical protein [Candidatus Angelobacter sp.]
MDGPSYAAFQIICAEDAEDALRNLGLQEKVAVLLFGSRLKPTVAHSILERYSSTSPDNTTAAIVLCADSEPELFQTLVDEGRVFYMARGDLAPEQLRSIVTCAAARFLSKLRGVTDPLATKVAGIDELLDCCIRLPMQEDLPSASGLLTTAARELINAEHVQYLIYDAEAETLTLADALDHREWRESAACGLAAFVARTGQRTRLDCVGLDPRYDVEIDNPSGPEDVRFLAVPLTGPQGMPAGVITATRGRESSCFSEEEALLLELLVECAAPTINQIALHNRVQALLLKRAEGTNSDMFREEALEYHIRSWGQQGDVLKMLPSWLRSTYWVTLVVFFAGLIGTVVGKMNVYASGPAVIRPHALKAPVANIVEPGAGYDLLALLPYSYSAQLHQGMTMHLKMRGEFSFGRTLLISQVDPEILDSAGVVHYAGKDAASMLPVSGRVIAVRGLLPEGSFSSDSLNRDGVTGEVEIVIRSEPAIVALIPGLRKIFRRTE